MLELRFKYNPWIKLEIKHAYFQRKGQVNFLFEADAQTEQIIRRAGLLTRMQASGLLLLHDEQKIEVLYQFIQSGELKRLAFWLYCDDDYFYHYSNLPLDSFRKILYFTNTSNPENPYLHPGEQVSETDLYPVQSPFYQVDLPHPESTFKLLSADQKEIISQSGQESLTHHLDLNNCLPGKYTLYIDEELSERFLLWPAESLRKPIALLEWHLHETLRKDMQARLEAYEPLPTYVYEMHFGNRSTFWRYFIVPRYPSNESAFRIDTGEAKVSFKGPEQTRLANGNMAFLFESKTTLSLQELSTYQFQLIHQKDTKGKEVSRIIKKLPVPGISSLTPEIQGDSSKLYSDMIVYV